MGETNLIQGSEKPDEQKSSPSKRDDDAIYQNGEVVARVIDAEVDLEGKEIRFGEIEQSDMLLLPDECEYQKYKIMIQRVTYATKADSIALKRGRILKGVIADILGYREQ